MKAILYFIATTLYRILRPLTMVYAMFRLIRFKKYKRIYYPSFSLHGEYFLQLALSYDRLGCVMIAPAANDFMLKPTAKHLYGNGLETISHATGVSYKDRELSDFGYFIAHTLNTIDKNHVEKAVDNNE